VLIVNPDKSGERKRLRVFQEPKTKSSVRKIMLSDSLVSMLKDHKCKQDAVAENSSVLFNPEKFVF
jgi:hypothetical protein